MNKRDFINWLKGFLDAHTSSDDYGLNSVQVEVIKKQLSGIKFDKPDKGSYIQPDENTTTTLLG
jgi:hypothetical protein